MTIDFSSETMKTTKMQHNIFQVVKEKVCQPRGLYLANIFFKNKVEIKKCSDEEKLREFDPSRPILK